MSEGAYNLTIYENLVFSVPPTNKVRPILLAVSFMFGLITYGIARAVLQFSGHISSIVLIFGVFVVPPLVTAQLTRRFPDFPINWGYLLGLTSCAFAFVFLTIELLFHPLDGWRLTGLGAAVILITSLAVLVLAAGTDRWFSLTLAGSPMSVALIGFPFIGSRWYGFATPDTSWMVLTLSTVGVGLGASVYVHERLIDANVDYIDGSQLTSTLLTGREADIDAGTPQEPLVQTFVIETGERRFTLAVPWVHPGPIANFGGGAIADEVIGELNSDRKGFFAKAPSTHEDDPAETAVSHRVLEALSAPTLTGQASRLMFRRYNGIDFHGRRYGTTMVMYLEPDDFGDFPPSLVGDIIDVENVLLIDRHAYEPGGDGGMRYGSVRAKEFRTALHQFSNDLEDAALYDYRAGVAVDTTGKQVCAIVEQVDDQTTVTFGSNENEISQTLRDLEAELADEFDEAVSFSTDTHHDMQDLAARRRIDSDRMRRVIEEAEDSVGPARAGLDADHAESTRLLGREYYALQYTINYVLRSFTVSLVALYVIAVLMLFV